MRSSEREDSGLHPLEEACLRRVMSRLRARLSDDEPATGRPVDVDAARQHACACGEIVID
jgi:hypothetical protein